MKPDITLPSNTKNGVISDQSYCIGTFLIITIFTLIRLWFIQSGSVDLSPDEAQYWDWSRRLDFSYYSKPPLIAFLIRASTEIFGNTPFAVRFFAVINSALLSLLTCAFVMRLFHSRRVMFFTILLLNILPLFSAGAVLMTTDGPLMLFWGLLLFFTHVALFSEKRGAWCWCGLFLGLGILSKYAAVYYIGCLFLFLAVSPRHRFWLKRREPHAAISLGLLFFTPVLVWNQAHDWAAFRHVAGQVNTAAGFRFTPLYFFEFIGSQFGVISPIVMGGLLWAAVRILRKKNRPVSDTARFLLSFSLPIFLALTIKSFQGKAQANWPALAYYAWSILGVHYFLAVYDRVSDTVRHAGKGAWIKGTFIAGLVIPLVMTGLIYGDGWPIPPKINPASRLKGWAEMGRAVSLVRKNMPRPDNTFVFARKYQLTSLMAFYLEGHPPAYCASYFGRRMNQYDIWPGPKDKTGWDAVYVADIDRNQPLDGIRKSFERVGEKPERFDIVINGEIYKSYMILRCYGFKGEFVGASPLSRY